MSEQTILLIAGTGTQRESRCCATDLWALSAAFRARRLYAWNSGLPWGVLCPWHGVVQPYEAVSPTHGASRIRNASPKQMGEWFEAFERGLIAVAHAAIQPAQDAIELHAPQSLVRPVHQALAHMGLAGIEVRRPLEGLGAGEQLAWYRARRRAHLESEQQAREGRS